MYHVLAHYSLHTCCTRSLGPGDGAGASSPQEASCPLLGWSRALVRIRSSKVSHHRFSNSAPSSVSITPVSIPGTSLQTKGRKLAGALLTIFGLAANLSVYGFLFSKLTDSVDSPTRVRRFTIAQAPSCSIASS